MRCLLCFHFHVLTVDARRLTKRGEFRHARNGFPIAVEVGNRRLETTGGGGGVIVCDVARPFIQPR